ncbi:MAG TPA: J domain-containing protein [Bacteroidia bacterium]|nr:J domain-containing protein [Bacteroidia bacterium]
MSTYYDILGVSQQAGSTEIKSAFRRLAKLYHPDKNPREKEVFAGILKAYETLIDPSKRAVYDRQLSYSQPSGSSSGQAQKRWTFEEREMRRRRYYEEHIKQYEKARPVYENPSSQKSSYNEFKYILFATPLAVALLLLVLRLASPDSENKHGDLKPATLNYTKLYLEDGPYTRNFGPQTDSEHDTVHFVLKNRSGSDLVLCFFEGGHFVRTCLIHEGEDLELEDMPKGPFDLRFNKGKHFDPLLMRSSYGQPGDFEETEGYYISEKKYTILNHGIFLLDSAFISGFNPVDYKAFFKKTEHDQKN